MTTATAQATNLLDRFIDWFIPDEVKAERDKRQQARMFLISHCLGPILGNVVPGALLFLDPTPGFPTFVLMASITAFWVFPFLLKFTGRYNLWSFVSVQNLNFCILWSCYYYGGVTSPTLPWVLTIPLLAFFYLGYTPHLRKYVLLQFALNFATFVALYHFVPPPFDDTPLEGLQGLGIVSTLACAGYVTMMAIYYSRILASGVELEAEMRAHLASAAQLRRATAEAERAGAAKAEFVASMSHELRTPLNAVIGYSQMLLEDAADEDDEDSIADLEKIHKAGHHLLRLVNEVLDLSKIEAGKMELVPEDVAVGEFINAIVDHKRAKADAKGVAVVVKLEPGLGTARWDGQRVRQSVGQVIDNAVKFTEKGQVTVTVGRRTTRGAENIFIEVRDTGIGIAPDMLPTLFEKFTVARDASASKYGDTGLGLALSLALCNLMGGSISAESVLGEGSVFTVLLPASPGGKRKRRARADATELAA
ncbi:HAMP domain-containing sensor histidine kinase [Phenylobacterium sp. J367]|uniref:sensor histidine kinase n=1 Tax=Phenylobacterium sp. J367 TaxID=2898435 RepID=UPI002150F44F|nr:HAMP domain-containing sensor histidine kinase [Phenylobacterium sp. J367]MCR5878612.1 HAMP domain-containing histidine kinase [Phenylobacterium sp. J367]